MADEQAWQDFWAGENHADAVGGGQRNKFMALWAAHFSAMTPGDRAPLVIDIAAGRGVALKAAIEALKGFGTFVALDYLPSVAAATKRALPDSHAAVADAARLPLPDGCVDAVISQFGIEYAGRAAFAEAARILAPNGSFCSISHLAGGGIDIECAANESLLKTVVRTRLAPSARATFNASYARKSRRDPTPIDPALDVAFASALAAASGAVRTAPQSAARATLARFLNDLTRLSARRFAYEPEEAIAWVDGMEASLDAYLKRMQSMRAAALDLLKVEAIAAGFATAGLADVSAAPLVLEAGQPAAAWMIKARRPA